MISTSYVAQILWKRSLLGEFWHETGLLDQDEKPILDCVKNAYSAVISPEVFKQAEDARAETGFGRHNPSGGKINNLFEKRCRCFVLRWKGGSSRRQKRIKGTVLPK